MRHPKVVALLSVLIATSVSCKRETETKPEAKAVKPPKQGETDESTAAKVRPVYSGKAKETPPMVTRLCKVLHALPKERKAQCCGKKPGVIVTSECVRNLSGALASGSIKLQEKDVMACEAAMERAFSGCDWVGPFSRPLPEACTALIKGDKGEGTVCRSSLECQDGLRCHGVGPTDTGRCGKPRPAGSLCGTGVDALAVYTRQDRYEETHPACDRSYCDRTRCRPKLAQGAACRSSVQCQEGRCASGKCVAEAKGQAGQACTGADCADGLRCSRNVCIKPKAPGEACTQNEECMGGCIKAAGAKAGVCKMSCELPPILQQIQDRRKAR